jgi:hypothetical protein
MDVAQRISRYVSAGVAIVGAMALSCAISPAKAADSYSEDAVKAAYLYRFAGYVNWPDERPVGAPFVIDVLGAPGVARELRRLLPDHPINNRVGQVREITGVRDLGSVQILYAGANHADILRTLTPAPGLQAMLLVTDEEGGLSSGSTLNFLTIDRNVRFEVSLTAADRWGLKISSELLGVAIRVQGGKRQSGGGCIRPRAPGASDGCAVRVARRVRRYGLPDAGLGGWPL